MGLMTVERGLMLLVLGVFLTANSTLSQALTDTEKSVLTGGGCCNLKSTACGCSGCTTCNVDNYNGCHFTNSSGMCSCVGSDPNGTADCGDSGEITVQCGGDALCGNGSCP